MERRRRKLARSSEMGVGEEGEGENWMRELEK